MPPHEITARQAALRVGLFALIGALGMFLFPMLMPSASGLLVNSALSTFGAGALANVIAARVYERGQASDFGLGWSDGARHQLLLGIACGAGAAFLVLAAPVLLRMASFATSPNRAPHPLAAVLLVSIALLFGAAGEEMLFHGYAFQLLTRSYGAFAIILPVGFLFGVAHLRNQNASLAGILNTIAWGILLGYACWRSKALWLPIGMHFGWNLALPLFGANLSGFTMGITGYQLHWSAGRLWSGGDYGPEGGLPTTLVVVALFWAVGRVTREE